MEDEILQPNNILVEECNKWLLSLGISERSKLRKTRAAEVELITEAFEEGFFKLCHGNDGYFVQINYAGKPIDKGYLKFRNVNFGVVAKLMHTAPNSENNLKKGHDLLAAISEAAMVEVVIKQDGTEVELPISRKFFLEKVLNCNAQEASMINTMLLFFGA